MEIVTGRNTIWQNQVIKKGSEFTVPDDIGAALIRLGVAFERAPEKTTKRTKGEAK